MAASGSGAKLPAGPMIGPRPGPTLESAVTAAVMLVTKSRSSAISADRQHAVADEVEREEHDHRADHVVGQAAAGVDAREDALGVEEVEEVGAQHHRHHLEAEDLDPARGRAGAAADEGQPEEHADRDVAPEQVVGRGEARGGDHRDHVEGGVAQRVERRVAAGGDEPGGQADDDDGEERRAACGPGCRAGRRARPAAAARRGRTACRPRA